MSNRMPSIAALLGLVAVAGYQNREKIGEFVRNLQNPGAAAPPAPGGDTGAAASGGLSDLIEHFRNSGLGQKAESWVSTGRNEPVDENEMDQALGPDLLDRLAQQTGLSRAELVKRLAQVLPEAVDHMTPEGRLPSPSREGAA
ncbi:YidB family protein [Aestuariivirga sp.]|uniref:YidB family protein n=1 Tax=Aestuariivirga sp. TaxID=2650926 RepID=UPI0025C175EE|nr:YidB family protein [Aestuariivirga sp.]MCA3554942.1 YidB family protein [Aestuariivirga sp.]